MCMILNTYGDYTELQIHFYHDLFTHIHTYRPPLPHAPPTMHLAHMARGQFAVIDWTVMWIDRILYFILLLFLVSFFVIE